MFRKILEITRALGRLVRRGLLLLILFYQKSLSIHLPPSCRFVPSCSNYAAEILQTQPLIKGLCLIFRRLLRCQPLGHGGFDPAPPPSDLL